MQLIITLKQRCLPVELGSAVVELYSIIIQYFYATVFDSSRFLHRN